MKKLVLLDMDGTVYLGDQLFDGVLEVFKYFKDHDIEFVFLTNNSSHSVEFYENKMKRMGVHCDAHNFYTSVETTIKYLKEHNFKTLCVLGVESFKEKLRKHFTLVDTFNPDKPVDVVLASFDTELVYDELRVACLYLQKGSKFIATNMDYRCPIEDGLYIPDCGGLCKWMEMCTGVKPTFLGKPAPEMIYQVEELFNVKPEEVIMVGDRHYTDIMAGINAGVDTLAVLTGETTKEEFENAEHKPTYIKESIKDLLEILENERA